MKKLREIVKRWLPGIISGGADNDPAGISTYSVSGAQFGYQQLWLMIISTPMLISVQAMCARLGAVKRQGLMSIIRDHYSPAFAGVAALILIITNIATLGADLAGMAEAVGLATNTGYLWWVIPLAVFLWYIVLFKNYRVIERYLFFLTFIFAAYIISGIVSRPNWHEVITAVIFPKITFSPAYFAAALGLMGTTITPFLFFWQSKQETEELRPVKEMLIEAKKEDGEVAPGFIWSNIISLFIMISTASVLHATPGARIASAADAARALEPIAGPFAKYVFAVGIIGSGLLAIPVLAASTAYVVAEVFHWRDSLSDGLSKAKGFYGVITVSIILGIIVAVSGIQPMKALLYSQVLNGILAPVLIGLILFMCNNKKIMGTFVNSWFDNVFGWVTVAVMVAGSIGLFWQLWFHLG
jgi:NRAMP (natural resistance-associated macrophage protein)-like metal ion transporter